MRKIMVFGTFDVLHKGHISFFLQAKKLANHLIVVVGRDKFVKKAKGKFPKNAAKVRVRQIRKTEITDKVVLGSDTYNYFRTLRTYKPEIIALGYDQKPSIHKLIKDLRRHRLANIKIVRLKPYKPNTYKSSKLKKFNLKGLTLRYKKYDEV